MGCGCNDVVRNWYDLENHVPRSPFELIAYASFVGLPGTFEYSADFLGSNSTATPLSLAEGASLQAWETDNHQMTGDAEMWTMQNKMVNVSTNIPPPLRKLAFVRGGTQWKNTLLIDVAVDLDYILVSFLKNAGTRGDAQGAVPVVKFDGPIIAGTHPIDLTLRSVGTVSLGLKTKATSSGDESMMELDLAIV